MLTPASGRRGRCAGVALCMALAVCATRLTRAQMIGDVWVYQGNITLDPFPVRVRGACMHACVRGSPDHPTKSCTARCEMARHCPAPTICTRARAHRICPPTLVQKSQIAALMAGCELPILKTHAHRLRSMTHALCGWRSSADRRLRTLPTAHSISRHGHALRVLYHARHRTSWPSHGRRIMLLCCAGCTARAHHMLHVAHEAP